MQASPETVLRFFTNHFPAISQIRELSKFESILKSETINQLCLSHQLDIEKLINYRILKQLKTGDYQLNIEYDKFISFLLDDFALDLPDSIKKNQEKIKEISSKLQSSTNRQNILKLIEGLIKVIKEFINNVETN